MARGRRIAVAIAATALALGTLVAAGCGGDDDSASGTSSSGGGSSLSGEIAGAGSSAQSAAQTAWAAGFQTENSGATVSYDPVGSGAGREQFISGGVAFGGSDVRARRPGADRRPEPLRRRGQPGGDPGVRLPDRGRLQPERRRRPPAVAGHAGEDHEPRHHQVERPGDRRREPGRHAPGHRHHHGGPLGQVGDDGELPAVPRGGRAEGVDLRGRRHVAGQGRRVRSGHLRRRGRHQLGRRHDRLCRREPGGRPRRGGPQGRLDLPEADRRGARPRSSTSRRRSTRPAPTSSPTTSSATRRARACTRTC